MAWQSPLIRYCGGSPTNCPAIGGMAISQFAKRRYNLIIFYISTRCWNYNI